jgi:capsular polysaccharide biosynthesis protein
MLGMAPLPPAKLANTEEWARQNGKDNLYKEIMPGHLVERAKAQTLDAAVDWRMQRGLRIANPATFLISLPKGRVIGPSGAIITADDFLLTDLSPDWFFKPSQHPLFWRLKLPSIQHLNGTYISLARLSGWNYAHWVLEMIPRLALIEKAGIDWRQADGLILNGPKNGWKTEILDLLGIPENKRIFLNAGDHLECDTLLVPSYVCAPDGFQRWMLDYLQQAFSACVAPENSQKKRVYIARNKAGYRHVSNEPEVIRLLENYGFESVYCEDLSFREKVNLFSSAEAVVAAHGAGLTHLAFCRPGTVVLEILSPDYVNGCFWALSDAAGLTYRYMLGIGKHPGEGKDPHAAEKDVMVDIMALEKALKQLHFA